MVMASWRPKCHQKKMCLIAAYEVRNASSLHQWSSGKAQQVRARLAANFIGWLEDSTIFDKQVERVIHALRSDSAAREEPPVSRL